MAIQVALSIGSGEGCRLFSLGDCFSIGVEGVAVLLQGESLVAELVEATGVLAPVGDDTR